ncbi:class I SAM-dependent methyltransferase [uncultured Hoeflea sp.]|uniref:SAM-dependent methyltransferase n=1 Tax=uncultured Hoeflea sp. TaxID=538666 RepID=UPI00263931FE|nr:class I SAM-dependent methyltransferase [uncultured Hoeflea sp.]
MSKPHVSGDAATFWEQHYAKMTKPSGGRPSAILARFADGRSARHALDLGCARGDDAIWLAKRGWTVTGVDVADAALSAAREAAGKAGVASRVKYERHDLGASFPQGTFDLVTAMFLHSPVAFDRTAVLRRAAAAVAPNGLLLIGAHGSRAPWSWAARDTVYPTAQDELTELKLDPSAWRALFLGPIEREATGPNGQKAIVVDNVVAIERNMLSGRN